jgi:hypothetical protein
MAAIDTGIGRSERPQLPNNNSDSSGAGGIAAMAALDPDAEAAAAPDSALALAVVLRARRCTTVRKQLNPSAGAFRRQGTAEALVVDHEAAAAAAIADLTLLADAVVTVSRGVSSAADAAGARRAVSNVAVRALLETTAPASSALQQRREGRRAALPVVGDDAEVARQLARILSCARDDCLTPRDRARIRRRLHTTYAIAPAAVVAAARELAGEAAAAEVRRTLVVGSGGRSGRSGSPGDGTATTRGQRASIPKHHPDLARAGACIATGDWAAALKIATASPGTGGVLATLAGRVALQRALCAAGRWEAAVRTLDSAAASPTLLLELEPVLSHLRVRSMWEPAINVLKRHWYDQQRLPRQPVATTAKALDLAPFEDPARFLLSFMPWCLWQPQVKSARGAWDAAMRLAATAVEGGVEADAGRLIYTLRVQSKHFRWQDALRVASAWSVVKTKGNSTTATMPLSRADSDFGSRAIHACMIGNRWAEATQLLRCMSAAGVPLSEQGEAAAARIVRRADASVPALEVLVDAVASCRLPPPTAEKNNSASTAAGAAAAATSPRQERRRRGGGEGDSRHHHRRFHGGGGRRAAANSSSQ